MSHALSRTLTGEGCPRHTGKCRFLSSRLRLSRNDKSGDCGSTATAEVVPPPIGWSFAIWHVLRKMAMDTPSLCGFLLLCLSLLMFWELVRVLKRKFARKSVTKVTWRSPRLFITCTYRVDN
jgi:hypothetical protein